MSGLLNFKRIGHTCSTLPTNILDEEEDKAAVGCIGGYSDQNYVEHYANSDLRFMEIFKNGQWHLTNQPLPALDDVVIWGASLVPLHGRLLLVGGITPKHGRLDFIFEYHTSFGFRLLPDRLDLARKDHVVIPLDDGIIALVVNDVPADLPNILVIGGITESRKVSKKVLNLKQNNISSNIDIEEFPDFPEYICGATAQVLDDNFTPIICGGKQSGDDEFSNRCYSYSESEWMEVETMTSERYQAGSVMYQDEMWVLGGKNRQNSLKTTEHLSSFGLNQSWNIANNLERSLSRHCVVDLNNEGRVMIIGGN